MELPVFYDEAEEWSKALLLYDAAMKEINTKLEILNNEFKMAHQYNPIEHISSRLKSPQSIAKKIRHKGMELTVENIVKYINDVAGVRIICSFTSDIYRIADLIAKQSDVKVLKVKDYIMCPKPNGYMSYHMIASVPIFLANDKVDTKVEIQIRTIAMDFWASLEHKIYYKFEGNAPAYIRQELKECAQIVSYLDQKMLSLNDEVRALEPSAVRKGVEPEFEAEVEAEVELEAEAGLEAGRKSEAGLEAERKAEAGLEAGRKAEAGLGAERKAEAGLGAERVPQAEAKTQPVKFNGVYSEELRKSYGSVVEELKEAFEMDLHPAFQGA